MSPSKALILNLVGLVSTLPLIILCLFSRAPKSEKTNKSNAVFFEKTHEVLPQSLYDKYEITLANHKGLKLNFADLMFCIRMLTRYPFSFYFNFHFCSLLTCGARTQQIIKIVFWKHYWKVTCPKNFR